MFTLRELTSSVQTSKVSLVRVQGIMVRVGQKPSEKQVAKATDQKRLTARKVANRNLGGKMDQFKQEVEKAIYAQRERIKGAYQALRRFLKEVNMARAQRVINMVVEMSNLLLSTKDISEEITNIFKPKIWKGLYIKGLGN